MEILSAFRMEILVKALLSKRPLFKHFPRYKFLLSALTVYTFFIVMAIHLFCGTVERLYYQLRNFLRHHAET